MLKKLIRINSPLVYMLLAGLVFSTLAFVYEGRGKLDDGSKTLLTVTSFVFGFYINSLISQARSRHSKVVESLREEGGYLKAIYEMSKTSFSQGTMEKQKDAIDKYLMASMDYRTSDYSKSYPEFEQLYNCLLEMGPDTKQQDGAWGQIIRIISEISKARSRIETLVKERVSAFEWVVLLALLGLVIYFVFSLNSGGAVSVVLTACIATSLTMLPLILYKLDSLKWKEDKYFWQPIEELFKDLDLIPYYPKLLVDQKRLEIAKGETVRLAEYPNPYPDLSGKKITTYTE